MLKISNVKVYGLEESIIASGYPFRTDLPSNMKNMLAIVNEYNIDYPDKVNSFKRAVKLGNAKSGSGHDSYLKGIIVQYDLTAPMYIWRQFQRYHFHDIISSQSTMHVLLKMDLEKQCNEYVWKSTIEQLEYKINFYKEQLELDPGNKEGLYKIWIEIISNLPSGFEVTARITSSYLQLKSIYLQRKHHKLKEDWGEFCKFIEELPYFKELCLAKKNDEN